MRAFAAAGLMVVAIALATLALEREPTPVSADADPRVFSGERAQAFRKEVFG